MENLENKFLHQEVKNEGQMTLMEKLKQKTALFAANQRNVANILKMENFKLDLFNKQSYKLRDDYIGNYVSLDSCLREQNERIKSIQK